MQKNEILEFIGKIDEFMGKRKDYIVDELMPDYGDTPLEFRP